MITSTYNLIKEKKTHLAFYKFEFQNSSHLHAEAESSWNVPQHCFELVGDGEQKKGAADVLGELEDQYP